MASNVLNVWDKKEKEKKPLSTYNYFYEKESINLKALKMQIGTSVENLFINCW